MPNKRIGVVARFGPKGFGFITDIHNREQFFVHIRDVAGYIELTEGDRVEFEEGQRRDARAETRRAIQVRLLKSVTHPGRILATDDVPRPASAPAQPIRNSTAAATLAEQAAKTDAPQDGSAQ